MIGAFLCAPIEDCVLIAYAILALGDISASMRVIPGTNSKGLDQ